MSEMFNVRQYGATGDGRTKDTEALNRAIAACHEQGGGTVRVPSGTYVTGTVELRSHITLHLDAGAVLLGSPDMADYPRLPHRSEFRDQVLIAAIGAVNVAITGRGTIDGNSDAFMLDGEPDLLRDFSAEYTRQGDAYHIVNDNPVDGPVKHKERPGILVLFLHCSNVHVSDILIRNSPNWCVHAGRCEDVRMTGLTIKNSLLVPNADGIDVSRSRNVRISDCHIEGGDDGLAFSPCAEGYGESPNENIVVENCTITSRSVGIRVGWDAYPIRNFLFHNIIIRDSNRGIGLFMRQGAPLENIVFSNIIIETRLHQGKWWGKGEPIHISVIPLPVHTGPAFTGKLGKIRNVTFSGITATGDQGIVIAGHPDSYIEGVTLENVKLTVREGPLQESFGGNFDFRPAIDEKKNVFAHDIPGLYAGCVDGLTIRNFAIDWQGKLPAYMKYGLEIEQFKELTIDGFAGRQPQPCDVSEGAAICLRDGGKARVLHSVAKPGTGIFLKLEGETTCGLFALNDVSEAVTPVEPRTDNLLHMTEFGE
ncbi:hypothetical protein GZH47_24840 [Paenibacillus rhizovicinus]|uniref:Glycoside hydrolase family 28 protein n=1 Tax=Paenibacillus rhizovicinus TaxID=2704463 RepID=A0A6C0P7U0_9BACL|nr:glycosyl hydrolase family 28 protein [Paenibacillus rhizovicinus]QHW33703.1 hypothetical protein GZH47_24840 [Paenibacillus rhizovicinus]